MSFYLYAVIYSLKKRAEAAGGPSGSPVSLGRPGAEDSTRFIELVSPAAAGDPECILEPEDPGGAKMRVPLKGIQVPDLTTLKHQPTRGSGAGASAGVVSDTVAVSLRPYSRQEQAATRPP